ncbi:unnamed protein product [Urochloa humidicola]
MMKININVALSKNTGKATAAAVARDGAGVFLGASVLAVDGITDPETMETLACREGLALASDLALNRVRLACDCANVIRSIKRDGKGPYGQIVQEIKARKEDFTAVDFVYEGRGFNMEAHRLARSSVYYELGRRVWFLTPPDGCNLISTTNQ